MTPSDRTRTWSATFELAVKVLSVLIVLGNGLSAALVLAAGDARPAGAALLGTMVLTLCAAGAVALLLKKPRATGPVYMCVAAACGGVLLVAFGEPGQVRPGWWVTPLPLLMSALPTLTLPPRRAVAPVAALLLTYVGACLLTAAPDRATYAMVATNGGYLIALPITMGVALWGIRAAMEAYDDLCARRRAGKRRETELRLIDSEAREADRLVHDRVLQALKALSLPIGSIPRELTRRLCGEAVQAFEGQSVLGDSALTQLNPLLAEAADSSGIRVRLRGGPLTVPLDVAEAIAAAAREALLNVRTHAGVETATVDLSRLGSEFRVEITDHGKGFDLDATGNRRGISASIGERMRDIGGQADIRSAAGEGSTVRLTWDVTASSGQHLTLPLALIDGLIRTFVLAATPCIVMAVWLALWEAPHLRDSAWPTIVTGVAAVVWTVAAVLLLRGAAVTRWALAPGWLAVVAAWVGGAALQPGTTEGGDYWLAGALCPLLLLAVFFRPLRESLPAAVALVGVVVAWVMVVGGGPRGEAILAPTLAAAVLPIASAYLVRCLIDHLQAQAASETRRIERVGLRVARLRLRAAARQERATRLSEHALPLCRAAAAGQVDVDDPATRGAARALDGEIRDALELAAPPPAGVRCALRTLRRHGWQVDLRGAASDACADGMQQLLEAVPATVTPGQLSLRVAEGPDAVMSLTATAVPGSAELRDAWAALDTSTDVQMSHDAEATRWRIVLYSQEAGLPHRTVNMELRA